MKTLKKLSLSLLTLGAIGIAGCQDYEPFSLEETRKGAFEKNFLEQYSKYLDPNQDYDLSGSTRCGKYNADELFGGIMNTGTGTRALAGYDAINPGDGDYTNYVTKTQTYVVENATLSWMKENLQESKDNRAQASPFYMRTAPAHSGPSRITLIPIYEGHAVMQWDLHIVIGDKDINLWKRHERLWTSDKDEPDESDWHLLNDGKDVLDNGEDTQTAKKVRGGVIEINTSKFPDTDFYFYLDIVGGHVKNQYRGETWDQLVDPSNKRVPRIPLIGLPDGVTDSGTPQFWGNYAYTGSQQKSTEGMMAVMPCPIPTNLGEPGTTVHSFVLGVEDADLSNSDWDMNDVVFLVLVGEVNTPTLIQSSARKRYMCEDLGNTYDFDFNDVVVDAYQYVEKHYAVVDGAGKFVEDPNSIHQRISIKHLGGTNPVQVKVGNKTFGTIVDPVNHERTDLELRGETVPENLKEPSKTYAFEGWNPDEEYPAAAVVTGTKQEIGWDPATNNITLYAWSTRFDASGTNEDNVYEDGKNTVFEINFPIPADRRPKGELIAPQILAVDPTLNWQPEHEIIPAAWFESRTQNVVTNNTEELDYTFNHTNLLNIGRTDQPIVQVTVSGNSVTDGRKLQSWGWFDVTEAVWSEASQTEANGNAMHVAYYNPVVSLKPGRYDFSVDVDATVPLDEINVVLGGGDYNLVSDPNYLWSMNRDEKKFEGISDTKRTLRWTVWVPDNVYPYGMSFVVCINRPVQGATYHVSNPIVQRRDADDITTPTTKPQNNPNANVFDLTSGLVWHSSWGWKINDSDKIPYQVLLSDPVEVKLKEAASDWNHANVGYNIPNIVIPSGWYDIDFDVYAPNQLSNLSVKIGFGDHIANITDNNQVTFAGQEIHRDGININGTQHVSVPIYISNRKNDKGISIAILLQKTEGAGTFQISNLSLKPFKDVTVPNPNVNYLGGNNRVYSTWGWRMANPVSEAAWNGEVIAMESKHEGDGWADLSDWNQFQFGVHAPQMNLEAKTYDVVLEYEASDNFGQLEVKLGHGKHIGSIEAYQGGGWNGVAKPLQATNPVNGTKGIHKLTIPVEVPSAGNGTTVDFYVYKSPSDGYYYDKTFKFKVLKLLVTDHYINGSSAIGLTNETAGPTDGLARRR